MLSLLKNKIRNKFLQTDYIHPYIIWCIDVFLSVISSFSIFLFFHYLINISIHFNQQRYILLIAVISSIVWTGICKTYEGIIRYSTLVELTRIIYAMLLKALTFVLFAYITLDRIVHLFHHYNRFYQFRFPAHVYTDINRQFLLSFITAFKKT